MFFITPVYLQLGLGVLRIALPIVPSSFYFGNMRNISDRYLLSLVNYGYWHSAKIKYLLTYTGCHSLIRLEKTPYLYGENSMKVPIYLCGTSQIKKKHKLEGNIKINF